MSHWTTVKTEITDEKRLEEALDDLKIKHRKDGKRIYLGDSTYVYYEKTGDGSYEIHHDFYYSRDREYGIKLEDIPKITNRYTYRKAVSEARKKGLTVADVKTTEDGTIKFKLRKWQ